VHADRATCCLPEAWVYFPKKDEAYPEAKPGIAFIVFRLMGKDYEASVISAGFGGITPGSTATAIVNMTAVARQYGAAHRAFIIVPLVCGFFIDLVNAFIINFFVGL